MHLGYTVLVADDEPDLLRVIGFRIKKAGYELVTATDGIEALSLISQRKPDLVLLDYRMPHMDGISVCAQMSRDPALCRIPVLIITASTELAHQQGGAGTLPQGVAGFIVKPFDPIEFLEKVKSFLPPESAKT